MERARYSENCLLVCFGLGASSYTPVLGVQMVWVARNPSRKRSGTGRIIGWLGEGVAEVSAEHVEHVRRGAVRTVKVSNGNARPIKQSGVHVVLAARAGQVNVGAVVPAYVNQPVSAG